jgi:(p)ppGpp synthase/HD superfamily hydrolase
MAETLTKGRDASARVRAAFEFARRAHRGQRRKQDGRPFVEHPIEVAELVAEAGADSDAKAAAYLHDVVEKTAVEPDEIVDRFGAEVAALIETLSEDPGLPTYSGRKRDLRARVIASGQPATTIYAADRLANVRDWVRVEASARDAVAARLGTTLAERLTLWEEDLAQLGTADPEIPFLGEIERAVETVRAEALARC